MTDFLDVSETDPRISYAVGAAQTVFTVPFIFFDNGDLEVSVNGVVQTLNIHYTVSGALNPSGGTVTFLAAQTGVTVLIVRDVPFALSTHIPASGPLDVPGLNFQFSKLVAMIQQMASTIDLLLVGTLPDVDAAVVTASGPVVVGATTRAVILNKAAPSVTPIQLPTVASRNKLSLLIADFAGNGGDVTITPATGEKIMGLAANAPWTLGSGGAGFGGSIRLYPVPNVGWVNNAP